jgi:hypothetical protein
LRFVEQVGTLAGLLSDQQRKQEFALRKTSEQLDKAHRELHENFEPMKRTERLYALGHGSTVHPATTHHAMYLPSGRTGLLAPIDSDAPTTFGFRHRQF